MSFSSFQTLVMFCEHPHTGLLLEILTRKLRQQLVVKSINPNGIPNYTLAYNNAIEEFSNEMHQWL